jgi:hypothetical protein
MTTQKTQKPSLAQKALTVAGIGAATGALLFGGKKLLRGGAKYHHPSGGTGSTPAPKSPSPIPRLNYTQDRKTDYVKPPPTGFDYSKAKVSHPSPAPAKSTVKSVKYNPPMPTPSEIKKSDMEHMTRFVKRYLRDSPTRKLKHIIDKSIEAYDQTKMLEAKIKNRSKKYTLYPRNLYDQGRRDSATRIKGALFDLTDQLTSSRTDP